MASVEKDKICAYCRQLFPIWDTRPINRGIDGKELRICFSCADTARNSGKVIQCDACRECFTPDLLHDEEIFGHSFTACPTCGKDVMEGMTREEFEKEHRPRRYAAVVRNADGSQRGYVVSVDSSDGIGAVHKKLVGKTKLDRAVSIVIGEVLTNEDEF